MELKKTIYNQLVNITRRNAPNEACAFLFDKNTLVIESFPAGRSPVHFSSPDPEIVQALIDKYGYPSALFHSHPGKAFASYRDEQYMEGTMKIWNCVWLIMSNKYDLIVYTICPMETKGFGRLAYKEEVVEIVNG